MSRLIDAEALKSNLELAEEKEYTTTGYILRMCDSLQIIDNAPIIDAIPTDWIRGKMKEYEGREFDEPGLYFRFVLWAWQKHCDEVNESEVKPKRLKDQVCGNDYCELR